MHEAQPNKPSRDKEGEIDRLYTYYVSRVRDVFEEHRRDHRRLFGQDYLCWAPPEREAPLQLSRRGSKKVSRRGSRSSSSDGKDTVQGSKTTPNPLISRRKEGSDCERCGHQVERNQPGTKEAAH